VRFVDGSAGIARRITHLTEGQAWPEAPGEGVAIFTGAQDERLEPALKRYGFGRIESLQAGTVSTISA